jgi:hypothetical protein
MSRKAASRFRQRLYQRLAEPAIHAPIPLYGLRSALLTVCPSSGARPSVTPGKKHRGAALPVIVGSPGLRFVCGTTGCRPFTLDPCMLSANVKRKLFIALPFEVSLHLVQR